MHRVMGKNDPRPGFPNRAGPLSPIVHHLPTAQIENRGPKFLGVPAFGVP
jgi:hypothetical protein